MNDVNKQLLDALGKISRMTMSMYASAGEAMSDAKRIANEAIAAAEQAQQAEPVAWEVRNGVVTHDFYKTAEDAEEVARDMQKSHDLSGSIAAFNVRPVCAHPHAVAVAVPDGYALVPIEPTEEQWGGLARDIMMAFDLGGKSPASLLSSMRFSWEELPEWMRKELHDPESNAVLSKGTRAVLIYRAMLAAAPQAAVAAPLPPYNVFSDDDGDSWREHPADADFVECLQLGEEFELLAGWRPVRVTFRVTKVPDDESDDYEVEEVTAIAAAQKP